MLSDKIERVNRLRQKALADPEFIQSAKAHERALKNDTQSQYEKKSYRKSKSLADIYQHTEFTGYDSNPNH
ncbi:hypothetical protein [Vibrio caribbeanicus]|uniref:hypothetical protein n=1 Tax=Vibrio caribbeanicus TaxID=701175 RepID=UPI0030DCF3F0